MDVRNSTPSAFSLGRGAFRTGGSRTARSGGRCGRENAGTSNDKRGENPRRRKPEVSAAPFVDRG